MENATEALLMVGGVLLGILTITLLVYMFGNISTLGNAHDKNDEMQRLADWNSEWEAYNKQLLYGTEVLTVINKVEQNNSEYDDDEMKIEIVGKYSNNDVLDTFADFVKMHKTGVYTCEKMEYNETGRVHRIIFKFLE